MNGKLNFVGYRQAQSCVPVVILYIYIYTYGIHMYALLFVILVSHPIPLQQTVFWALSLDGSAWCLFKTQIAARSSFSMLLMCAA